jgi:hypothetical protein
MTRAQILAAMAPLVRALLKAGWPVTGFDGIAPATGQVMFSAPSGVALSVTLPVTALVLAPLEAFVASAEGQVRTALRAFEGFPVQGFAQGGTQAVAEPGSLAAEVSR